jgi:SOS-response transcriptional repressor LexA
MRNITEKQENILLYISDFIKQYGYSPTVREIGKHFNITASAAYDHLIALQKKGYICWEKRIPRTKIILNDKSNNRFDLSTIDGQMKALVYLHPIFEAIKDDEKRTNFIAAAGEALGITKH